MVCDVVIISIIRYCWRLRDEVNRTPCVSQLFMLASVYFSQLYIWAKVLYYNISHKTLFISDARRKKSERVLVFSEHGRSRAVTAVMAYLIKNKWTLKVSKLLRVEVLLCNFCNYHRKLMIMWKAVTITCNHYKTFYNSSPNWNRTFTANP